MRTRSIHWKRLWGIVLGGTVLAAAGLGAPGAGPSFAAQGGASQVCLDCHEESAGSLTGGPHRLFEGGTVTCLSCHQGDAAGHPDDPEAHPLSNPAALDQAGIGTLCTVCHGGRHQDNQRTGHAHAAADMGCLDCHQVHGGTAEGALKSAQPGLCYGCHAAQRSDFAMPYRHPVSEGVVQCSDCHLAIDDRHDLAEPGAGNEACLSCHREFQGPFPYEHQAAVGYSSEEGGCLTCHHPHGSALPLLLKQPYGGPHDQLCAQCHAVPGHSYNSRHGDEFAGVACAECHTDIHGSYTSRNFLSPAVTAQGCQAIGCHQP